MDEEAAERLVAAVEEARDVEFRAAIYYRTTPDGVEYEMLRLRPDIRELYDEEERAELAQAIVDDLALEQVAQEWHEQLYGAGDLYLTTRVFERATVVNVGGDGDGLYLSLDNDELPFAQTLVEAIDEHFG